MHTDFFLPADTGHLDPHTESLLAEFEPSSVIVVGSDHSTEQTSEIAAAAAVLGEHDSLIIADADLRAEANALANLLDLEVPITGVLLANNGDDSANPSLLIDATGHLSSNGGHRRYGAGVFVISGADGAAFAQALADADPSRSSAPDYFTWLVEVLAASTSAFAIEAAPFCASRQSMDLPAHSEEERRLRAAATSDDDVVTAKLMRPLSRRITRWAVSTNKSAAMMLSMGTLMGVVAALIASFGGLLALVPGVILLQISSLLLMSSGEVARYWRRPSAAGAHSYQLVSRLVEILFVFGLAVAAAGAGWPSWVFAAAAIGFLAIASDAILGRRLVLDSDVARYRPLRWLAISIVTLLLGSVYGIYAAIAGNLVVLAVVVVSAMRQPRELATEDVVVRSRRFLEVPGALSDIGIPVRAISNSLANKIPVPMKWSLTLGMAALMFFSIIGWGRSVWLILPGVLIALVAAGLAMSQVPIGAGAWAIPATFRAMEVITFVAIASTVTSTAAMPVIALMAAVALMTCAVADNWLYLGMRAPAWVTLAGFGFDGRMLLITILGLFGLAMPAMLVVAALAALSWLGLVFLARKAKQV